MITAGFGPLRGRRVVAGREEECVAVYAPDGPASSGCSPLTRSVRLPIAKERDKAWRTSGDGWNSWLTSAAGGSCFSSALPAEREHALSRRSVPPRGRRRRWSRRLQRARIVQMLLPEQHAWGGVLKRRLLCSGFSRGTLRYRLRRERSVLLWYTRRGSTGGSQGKWRTRLWTINRPGSPWSGLSASRAHHPAVSGRRWMRSGA